MSVMLQSKFTVSLFIIVCYSFISVNSFFCVEHLVRYSNIWHPGQSEQLPHGRFFQSPNSAYFLDFYCNGSLELRESLAGGKKWGGTLLWSSYTTGKDVRKATLSYGILSLFNANDKEVWASGLDPCPVYNYAEVKNDGRLVIYCGNKIIWSSETAEGSSKFQPE